MKTANRLAEIDKDLAETNRLLEDVRAELRRAPDHRRGTRWWDDRAAARQRLLRHQAELHAERHEIASAN